jgi:hypothetical protein
MQENCGKVGGCNRRERSSMPFFDAVTPYYVEILNGQFPFAVNTGLLLLNETKKFAPEKYENEPKGTPFYFMGIAAFASHDYQTATFFFDAAVAEDVAHHKDNNNTPALRFMRLEKTKLGETAAQQVVDIVVAKLEAALKNYIGRDGSRENLELKNVREHFLDHLQRPHFRTLTSTFISFLAEWDYRVKMIDLTHQDVSREPFFTHLFRGCLLFESLLKENPVVQVNKTDKLGNILKMPQLKSRLGIINKIDTYCPDFEKHVQLLTANTPPETAIECTVKTRNALVHNLVWATQSLNQERYDLLANDIASSCLHAIACLYVKQRSRP